MTVRSPSHLDAHALLTALTEAHGAYHDGVTAEVLFDRLLTVLLHLTGSEYGFIGEVLNDGAQDYLRTWAITNIAWNDETRRFYDENAPKGLEFRNLKSLFGACIVTGEPVIANQPATDARRTGLPPGHPSLDAFLGVPIPHAGVMVGMAGIANRAGGYDEQMTTELAPLLTTLGLLIHAYRESRVRKGIEDRLRDREQRLAMVVETAASGIVTADADGMIVSANPAVEQIFGYSPRELSGLSLGMLMTGDDAAAHSGYMSRYEHTREAHVIGDGREVLARHRNGHPIPIHLAVSRFESEGVPSYTGVITDLTALKATEKALVEAKERAEDADRAKSQFLATMSHEIRTPINGIIGMIDLLTDTRLDSEQRDFVDTINSSAHSLLSLVNDVLDFAKIEADRVELEHVVFDPVAVVDDAIAMLRAQAITKGIHLGRITSADVPGLIEGDPDRFKQILVNLIGNAIKFTDHGHVIAVVDRCDDDLVVEVEDTGIGIENDKLERVFEEFIQADSTTTRRFGGSGLGLAISRKLVEAMHGTLSVTSVPGSGSTFVIRLPILEAPQRSTDLRGRTVVVVHPDTETRTELSRVIRTLGATVIPVSAIDAGREILAGGSEPDAMLVAGEFAETCQPAELGSPTTRFVVLGADQELREAARRGWSGQVRAIAADPVILGRALGVTRELISTMDVSAMRRGTILVVEDDDTNRKVIHAALRRAGFTTRSASNGRDAITEAAQGGIDLVLMDVRMPDMDGIEATAEIRALPITQPPIVIMTGDTLQSTADSARRAGADEIVNKPVRPRTLVALLEQHLDAHAGTDTGAPAAPDRGPDHILSEIVQFTEDEDTARSFVVELAASSKEKLARLEVAAATNDWETIRSIAHQMRNTARLVGDDELAHQADLLDDPRLGGSPEDAARKASEFATMLGLMVESLDRVAGERAA